MGTDSKINVHLKWHGRVHRRPETAPIGSIEGLYVHGARKRGRPVKTFNEIMRKDMMVCGDIENMGA